MLKFSTIFLLIALSFILSSCTGLKKKALAFYVNKNKDGVVRSDQLIWKDVPKPYVKKQHDVLDGFWLNEEKGSSISYFSSCSDIPRSLKAFQISSYPSDLKYKILKRIKDKDFLYSLLGVQVDSHRQQKTFQTYIAIHSLRKKNCFFNLNLVAPSLKVFQEEEETFQQFIQHFKPL